MVVLGNDNAERVTEDVSLGLNFTIGELVPLPHILILIKLPRPLSYLQ